MVWFSCAEPVPARSRRRWPDYPGRGRARSAVGAGYSPVLSRTIPPRALVLLAVLTLVWGSNWPLFALATRELSVWTFRASASLIAGSVLLAAAAWRGLPLAIPRRHWATMGVATLCYLVLWNVASTYAAILIPSGQAAILGFTMPLWAALLGWALLGQRLGARMLLALALGAAAVGLLVLPALRSYAQAPLGVAAGLLAALGWAAGTLILKRQPVPVPALVLTGWQLLLAALPLGVGALALAEGPWFVPDARTLVVVAWISLVPMAVGYAAWFAIVAMLPAQVAGLSSIGVPMVAMLAGAFIHGEPLGPTQWAAMTCSALALWLCLRQ